MKSLIRALVLMSVLAALMIMTNSAYADSFNFAFSGSFFGSPVSGSGTFTTTPQPGGSFLITGISGTMNGQPMTLATPGTQFNDNLLFFPSTPFVDGFGVSFYAPFLSNIEFNTTDPSEPIGYILASSSFAACFPVSISFSVSPSTVPEPATLILFGSGAFALGAAWRRKRLK